MQQSILCCLTNADGLDSDPYKWCYISSPKAPAPPDPVTTANAQTASNVSTAQTQAGLNNVNQSTPLGSINYTYGSQDINGQKAPQTNSNVTLNPDVQHALTSSLQTQSAESDLAKQYEGQVANTMNHPYDLNSVGGAPQADAAFQKRIMDSQDALQQPYVDRSNEQLQAQLANQGITQGSQAYHNAMLDQNNSLNNLQQQNVQNATAQEQAQFGLQDASYQNALKNYHQDYTMPLNQLSALQSGSQVAQPSFTPASQTSVAPTNVAGIYNQGYQNQLGASNANAASHNSQLQSLFGLGGTIGSAVITSDIRLKDNIKHICVAKNGLPVYQFKYKKGGGFQYGHMAQDVEKICPQAVVEIDGYKAVNYGVLYGSN
jgi:hypothetical protein